MTAVAFDRLRRPPAELLQTLAGLCGHYGKPYTFPSQQKLLELLTERYRVTISRRTLNRWLYRLEHLGLINRQRRHVRERSGRHRGRLILRSTLYFLTGFGRRILRKTVDNLSKFLRDIAVPHSAQHVYPVRLFTPKTLTAGRQNAPPAGRNGNAPPLQERDL